MNADDNHLLPNGSVEISYKWIQNLKFQIKSHLWLKKKVGDEL